VLGSNGSKIVICYTEAIKLNCVTKDFKVLYEFNFSAKHSYLRIGIDEGIPCVMDNIWTGAFGSLVNFRNGLEKVAQVLEEKGYSKWLADLRHMEGSWDSSRE
jgi:hypothetical protein